MKEPIKIVRVQPRDATRGGVNFPALPGKRGRESPLLIDAQLAKKFVDEALAKG